MTAERIMRVDEERTPLGAYSRETVHKEGYLHETFHCWVIQGMDVVLQIRSSEKQDFPEMLDISAAGHLLAGETVMDGVREIEEEIGLRVSFEELIPIGVIKDEILLNDFLDREWAHVYAFKAEPDTVFTLQVEEVKALDRISITELQQLWAGEEVRTKSGRRIRKSDFVPHEDRYMNAVIKGLTELMRVKG